MTTDAAVSEKKRAALASLVAALFLTALKVAVGASIGSLGVLAEAAHSALDLVAAAITFLAIRISTRPADREHAYGHGKAENLAALAETLLLLLTCGWIVHEAIDRLFFNPGHVQISVWAFVVMLISIVVDINRARMLSRVAKKHNSQALEADALHFSTDIFSSAVVILGLAAVWAASFATPGSLAHEALMRADSAAALVVAAIVVWVSLKLGYRAVHMLLDGGDGEAFEKIEKAVGAVPDVLRVKSLRIRQSGPFVFADMQLVLPASSSLEYSHTVTEAVEKSVCEALPGADLIIHCEPESSNDDLVGRIQSMGMSYGLDVHSIEIYTADSGNFVTLHAAVEPQTKLAGAHKKAHAFEEELARYGYKALTHIEPRRPQRQNMPATELDLPDEKREAIMNAIDRAMALEAQASRRHKIVLLDTPAGWSLSFHCCMPGDISVEDSHQVISRIESYLHKNVPELSKIIIHTDVLEELE